MNIEWSESENGMILLLLDNGKFIFYLIIAIGEIKLLNLEVKTIVNIEVLWKPTSIKWHPRRENLVAIGYTTGQVSFVDVITL